MGSFIISGEQLLGSIGLFLDIVGVALLFVYGNPQPVFPEADTVVIQNQKIELDGKATKRKYIIRSRVALSLLGLGFFMQLLALWCK